ncbi:Zinc finger protein [Penicillium alfredii]|uniref:Zinc finger protein n=1 Tax=Penicillium alfredii TaxID=1506179 RepID=A0A9W9FLA4_9EURO|nr:Zinc finger protein [Penicillium alfredii]KAJ5102293.1 Zinc finger protein [Penicillium alfredii]
MAQEEESRTSTPRSFTGQSASAEEMLKSQTVGLVHLSDFRKRRAEVLEQKEREAHDKSLGRLASGNSRSATPSTGDVTDGSTTPRSDGPPRKKKKKPLAKSKLSFGDDNDDTGEDSAATPRESSISRSNSKTPVDDGARRMKANPNAPPPPKAMTKATVEAEAQARDTLRKEFLTMQEAVKNTEILIPFVFYDGTNIPAGNVKVKKGDPVWLFLDRCRKVGAELGVRGAHGARGKRDHRREWARVSVDDLMLVKGDVIVPHVSLLFLFPWLPSDSSQHYEFYYFIANRIPSFSRAGGLLFDYSDKPQADSTDDALSRPNNDQLEGANKEPTVTKVVDRRWYEKNKHIYPASLWHEYEPGKEFEEEMTSTRQSGSDYLLVSGDALRQLNDADSTRHVFCLKCAASLGLSHPTSDDRRCPACQSILPNPDDAASTILNPTEDYKTSVLSGLDPTTIMECAGRALGFWTYQSTQEIFYQEFLGKTLTEKYTNLSTQMDKVIHNANTEIMSLQSKVSGRLGRVLPVALTCNANTRPPDMQAAQGQLQRKNQELADLCREKSQKLSQMTNLYNLLKARAMRTRMQTAASDTVSQTLNSLSSRAAPHTPAMPSGPPAALMAQQPRLPQSPSYHVNADGVEQLHRYQRSGTGSSKRARKKTIEASAMPPPGRPMWNGRSRALFTGEREGSMNHDGLAQAHTATPQHRTRLPRPSRPPTALSQFPPEDALLERFGG